MKTIGMKYTDYVISYYRNNKTTAGCLTLMEFSSMCKSKMI